MEVKMDLAVVLKMMVGSQNKGIEEAIEKTENLLETAEHGLATSYERLEEAKANDDKRQVIIIQDYIHYLKVCIEKYSVIRDAYAAILTKNHDLDSVMNDILRMR